MINPPLPYTPHHSSRALTKPNLSHFQHKCMSLSIFFSCKIRISLDCFTTSIILLRDSLFLSLSLVLFVCPVLIGLLSRTIQVCCTEESHPIMPSFTSPHTQIQVPDMLFRFPMFSSLKTLVQLQLASNKQ